MRQRIFIGVFFILFICFCPSHFQVDYPSESSGKMIRIAGSSAILASPGYLEILWMEDKPDLNTWTEPVLYLQMQEEMIRSIPDHWDYRMQGLVPFFLDLPPPVSFYNETFSAKV